MPILAIPNTSEIARPVEFIFSYRPTFRTSSYTFIYFYIPQDVLTRNLHCRNYY
ncbi:unknown protein [Microcystis aeruginosa NIES-843]|uniref:Uncharacterized protein n=1 Tax=Microcystis aeruginosa (strain NIES-843 / IAM M-2473) TaxID=449447 RepID=B0JGH1_MICAN|nr:unknown protein [Microcystis aeruginosa NIES-843]